MRHDGLQVAGSESEQVAERIVALKLSASLTGELTPLFVILAPLNVEILAADRRPSHRRADGGRSDRHAADNHAGHWADHGERTGGRHRSHYVLPLGVRLRGVPRRRTWRAELGQKAASWADHEGGERPPPVAAG